MDDRINELARTVERLAAAIDESSVRARGLALLRLATILSRLDRVQEALERSLEAEQSFLQLGSDELLVIAARIEQANMLVKLERYEELLDLFRSRLHNLAIEITDRPDVVPKLLLSRALAFEKLGLEDEAAVACDICLRETEPAQSAARRQVVAAALIRRARIGLVRGDAEAGLADVDRGITYVDESALRQVGRGAEVERMYLLKAALLEVLGRGEEADRIYAQVSARADVGEDPLVAARRQRAELWHRRVSWLIRKQRIDELERLRPEIAAAFQSEDDRVAFEHLRDALHGLCGALLQVGRSDPAFALMDELMERLEQSSDPADRGRVTVILAGKATTLVGLGRDDEAAPITERWKQRVGPDTWQAMDEMLSSARRWDQAEFRAGVLLQRAAMLDQLGEAEPALRVLRGFADHFSAEELSRLGTYTAIVAEGVRDIESR